MLACLPNPLETADLVAFAEEILNGKLHFLCSDNYFLKKWNVWYPASYDLEIKSTISQKGTCVK